MHLIFGDNDELISQAEAEEMIRKLKEFKKQHAEKDRCEHCESEDDTN